jgi:hypothetical protein
MFNGKVRISDTEIEKGNYNIKSRSPGPSLQSDNWIFHQESASSYSTAGKIIFGIKRSTTVETS